MSEPESEPRASSNNIQSKGNSKISVTFTICTIILLVSMVSAYVNILFKLESKIPKKDFYYMYVIHNSLWDLIILLKNYLFYIIMFLSFLCGSASRLIISKLKLHDNNLIQKSKRKFSTTRMFIDEKEVQELVNDLRKIPVEKRADAIRSVTENSEDFLNLSDLVTDNFINRPNLSENEINKLRFYGCRTSASEMSQSRNRL